MKTKTGFIEGVSRLQATLFPELLDDYISEESSIRVIDMFVDNLDLAKLEFKTISAKTGRPGYHPSIMLKLFIYGYLNCIQSSRRLERESGRNVELMWLLGRLSPDFKTIADKGYYSALDIKDAQDAGMTALVPKGDTSDSEKKGIFNRSLFEYNANKDVYICPASQELTHRLTGVEKGITIKRYFLDVMTCRDCHLKPQCSTSKEPRRIARIAHISFNFSGNF